MIDDKVFPVCIGWSSGKPHIMSPGWHTLTPGIWHMYPVCCLICCLLTWAAVVAGFFANDFLSWGTRKSSICRLSISPTLMIYVTSTNGNSIQLNVRKNSLLTFPHWFHKKMLLMLYLLLLMLVSPDAYIQNNRFHIECLSPIFQSTTAYFTCSFHIAFMLKAIFVLTYCSGRFFQPMESLWFVLDKIYG